MLLRLGIRNFALIDQLHIDFQSGITVITGETGAGKSILIDALSILLGDRASLDFIRQGKDIFYLDGQFDISHREDLKALLASKNIEVEENMLYISRSFSTLGKGLVLINDHTVPLKVLKEVGQFLANIHGQYSNQSLLNSNIHHEFLDFYTKESRKAYHEYVHYYEKYSTLKKRLNDLEENSLEKAREIDMLHHQIHEIDEANIVVGEDEKLSLELTRFNNYERLYHGTRDIYNSLIDGNTPILDQLSRIKEELDNLKKLDQSLEESKNLLDTSYFQLEEVAHMLSQYVDSISYDEERYIYCQERDALLYSLKKKYGPTLEDVENFRETSWKRLEELEINTSNKEELEKALEEYSEKAYKALKILNALRYKNNETICQLLKEKLNKLGMEKAHIQFIIEESDTLTPLGAEKIEIAFSPNQGEGYKELSKIVSGGELSRLALAFSSLFKEGENKVIVYDEIDVGISGEVAIQVAEQIKSLSEKDQVLCVTHMPQTVAIANHHYHLEKEEMDQRTYTKINVLSEEEHIQTMAKMISGDMMDEASINTAKNLINRFKTK